MDETVFIQSLKADFPHFKVTKNNLAQPTSEFVILYYSKILNETFKDQSFFEFTEEQQDLLNNHHPEGNSLLQYVKVYNLYAILKYIFSFMNMEFSFSDLVLPDRSPRRSFTFMSTIINIYAYCGEFDDELEIQSEGCAADINLLSQLQQEKKYYENLLISKKEEKLMYREKTDGIRLSANALNVVNEENQKVLKEIHQEFDAVKEQESKLEEEQQNVQKMLMKLEDEKKLLESMIVSDQNQVLENHRIRLQKKEECTKKVEQLKDMAECVTQKGRVFDAIIKLQLKWNSILKDETVTHDKYSKPGDFKSTYNGIKGYMKEIVGHEDKLTATNLKISEAEDAMPKLKDEEAAVEAEQGHIYNKESIRTGKVMDYLNSQKKSFAEISQILEGEAAGNKDLLETVEDLRRQCCAVEQEIRKIDDENVKKYEMFNAEMMLILNEFEKKLTSSPL